VTTYEASRSVLHDTLIATGGNDCGLQRPPATQPDLQELFNTGDYDQATFFRFHEPGSKLENVLGRLQISMYGGSPLDTMAPIQLETDSMETANRADVICVIPIYTVNNAAKGRDYFGYGKCYCLSVMNTEVPH
jgi:hypothetical protein